MSDLTASGSYPWHPASATGVGSLPGTDPAEAARLIFGELPDLPHLAELPGRGPGADLTGRTAALLVDLPVETSPGGWRFTTRPGRDASRAHSLLDADLDALQERAEAYRGPLKVAVCGPWTLAATIELARSQDPALADPGAVADLTESLAEGVRAHLAEIAKRVPGASLVLQLDEPSLPTVLAGGVPTASGLNRLPAPDGPAAAAGLSTVLSAAATLTAATSTAATLTAATLTAATSTAATLTAATSTAATLTAATSTPGHSPAPPFTLVHCCAAPVPFDMIKDAGAGGVGFDLSLLRGQEDALAEAAEAGLGIFLGVLPALPTATGPAAGSALAGASRRNDGDIKRTAGGPPSAESVANRVGRLWHRLGWPVSRVGAVPEPGRGPGRARGPASVADQVVFTPACGLAGATPAYARAVLARCREAARLLPELIEEGRW